MLRGANEITTGKSFLKVVIEKYVSEWPHQTIVSTFIGNICPAYVFKNVVAAGVKLEQNGTETANVERVVDGFRKAQLLGHDSWTSGGHLVHSSGKQH